MRSVFVLASLLLAVSGGCGSSNPSEQDAQQVLRDGIKSQPVKLVSFQKTDGQASTVFGVPCYDMHYEAVYEFIQDGYWNGRHGKRGEQVTDAGTMAFHKSEKGWRYGPPGPTFEHHADPDGEVHVTVDKEKIRSDIHRGEAKAK